MKTTRANNTNCLPRTNELARLLAELKRQIGDDYRAVEECDVPSMQVTLGWTRGKGWNYQTGDNSYAGGAYGHQTWAIVYLDRSSNCLDLARSAVAELLEMES